MKPSPRVILASIASVLLILLLNTCGIESFIQLNPPSNPEQLSDYRVSFEKTTDNNERGFTGFDLYYKFYGSDPYSDLNSIVEFEDLEEFGFRRIHDSDDNQIKESRPLIPIDLNDRYPEEPPPANNTNDAFTLFVYLSGAPTDPSFPLWFNLTEPIEYPIIVDDGNTDLIDDSEPSLPGPKPILIEITDIRRDVFDDFNNEFKKFSDFDSNDSDIKGIDYSVGKITLVLYVVSCGLDISSGTYRPLHSKPIRLGIIYRNFPLSE
jgi:hypothetical protein